MRKSKVLLHALVAALLCSTLAPLARAKVDASASGGILDVLILGDPASEQAHHLDQSSSDIIHGGLDQSARELLPLVPVSYNGGWFSFTAQVDASRQNYLTVKLWGSDHGAGHGRLLLYIDGLQCGYRHEGDHDVLNQCDEDPLYRDRFVYQTVPLPLALTRGKTTVTLKIAALGAMWPYGQNFQQMQKALTEPSRGIYRAYVHTATRFEPPATDLQAAPPPPATRPPEDGDAILAKMKTTVISRLDALLADRSLPKPDDEKARQAKILLLAEAYEMPWTPAYHNPKAIAALVKIGDDYIRPGVIGSSWLGSGPLGLALAKVGADPLLLKALDESIEVPTGLPYLPAVQHARPGFEPVITPPELAGRTVRMTRREAWAAMLRASIDWHRFHGRRFYTNQSMIVDFNIYTANRGLMIIDPSRALPEAQTLHYLHEATGLSPWLGNDLPGGGSAQPYGTDYYEITPSGLSRELGWVGSYGETILTFIRDMAELTGDPALRAQLIKLETARIYFRYPSVDADGYRTMKLCSEIDSRTAHFPMPNAAYGICDIREAWWMEIPAFTRDTVAIGAAQQCLDDNQYFPRLAQRINDPDTLGMMRNIDQYATVRALPRSPFRLPGTEGRPDFVFADPTDAVIALKHGDEHLFVNFYFRQEFGVSGVTRILDVTPDVMRIASVLSDFKVDAPVGEWTRRDDIDMERNGGMPPPGEDLHQAWAGEKLPIAPRPAGATQPRYGSWGPFVGKADFYHLRYGDYIFAVNTTAARAYELPAVPGVATARDLATGRIVDLTHPVKVDASSVLVLYVGDNTTAAR